MSIGDVTSNARGSGARFNDGKPDLALIPLEIIAASFGYDDQVLYPGDISYALGMLGRFQVTADPYFLRVAIGRLHAHWSDCARVFEYGRRKYAAWNWAKGMDWSIPLACAARHALALLDGLEIDAESGLPHVGHMLCNLVMLRLYVDTFPEGNDLPPADLFRRAMEKSGLPAEHDDEPLAYLASFGPNVLRDEALRKSGIGDVTPRPETSVSWKVYVPEPGTVAYTTGANDAPRHPMCAEVDRLKRGDML